MAVIQGAVVALETGCGVAGLTVVAHARGDQGTRVRIGSVATDTNGKFRLTANSAKHVWTLDLEVLVDGLEPTTLYRDTKPREQAGATETWTIRLRTASLVAAGVLSPTRSLASDLPALGSVLARTVVDGAFEEEIQSAIRARLDPRRERADSTLRLFRAELVERGRGGLTPAPTRPIRPQVLETIQTGLAQPAMMRPRRGFVVATPEERAALVAATGPDGRVSPDVLEPLLFGDVRDGTRVAIDLLTTACRIPRALDEACPPNVLPPASAPTTTGEPTRDLADAVWRDLHSRSEPQVPRPDAEHVWRRIDGLHVTAGPADAPALHDFSALNVPFEDVWRDLVDDKAVHAAVLLHDEIDRLGGQARPVEGTPATDHLRREAAFLARQAPLSMRRPLASHGPLPLLELREPGLPDPLGDGGTRWVTSLLAELERAMAEPYRFTVYGADDSGTAVNFGLVTTYRQTWHPLGYQAGRLVETVTLAPREERTYTRKVSTTKKRRTETKEKWRAITRSEEQATQRAVRDIVATAEHRTGLEASGSYGPVSGSLTIEDGRTSSDTRQSFREAVRKASSEYETDRSLDVSFESISDVAEEHTGKLTNPNDELAVTYLFYQLQRRFRVSEHLHRVTPVILVAQPVPPPDRIDITWLLQHDWILRRVLLDPSFVSALDTVNSSLVGEEATVGQLRTNLDQQREVVATLRTSLEAAHARSSLLFQAMQGAVRRAAGLHEDGVPPDAVERIIAWLTGGESDAVKQARIDTAREALDRSEVDERAIAEQLQRELASLTGSTAQWAAASRSLLDKTVDVQRLRLHVKQNVFYYMQAIWDHEPPDQRYFRLHQLPVPVVAGELHYALEAGDPPPLPPHWTAPLIVRADARLHVTGETVPLAQVADLDRPLGYKGNYAIFPLRESNLVARYLSIPYVDRHAGAHDPDHLANLTRTELEAYSCCLRRHLSAEEYAVIRPGLDEAHRRLLADPRPLEEEVVVPTDALFIEALPADRPLLEDYKLRARAADAAKLEAEAARVRLDNVRRGARILASDLSDPDIDRRTVIEGASLGVVLPGDS